MKSFLVLFFGICVIMTTATETLLPDDSNQQYSDFKLEYSNVNPNEDPYVLIQFVWNYFKTAQSQVKTNIAALEYELNKIASESITNILFSSTTNLKSVETIVTVAKSKLGPTIKNKNCSEIYLPQLEVFKMKGEVDVDTCVNDAAIKTANTKGKVQEDISAIQFEVAKVNDVLPKCIKMFWPYDTLSCLVDGVRQVGLNSFGKINNAYEAVKKSFGEFYHIFGNAKVCIDQIEANAKVLSGQIDECLK